MAKAGTARESNHVAYNTKDSRRWNHNHALQMIFLQAEFRQGKWLTEAYCHYICQGVFATLIS